MNYDMMSAGPELNRLIARDVMKWTPRNDHNDRWWYGAGAEDGRHVSGETDVWQGTRLISFKPTTNIAHAWEVLDHLKSGEAHIIPLIEDRATHWTVELHSLRHRWRVGPVSADTAPLAICLCALKAVAGGE